MPTLTTDTLRQRLLKKSMPTSCGCRIWIAGLSGMGYGSLSIGRKGQNAHKLAYVAFKGPIPNGLNVLHTCNVRACIEPNHLYLGTKKDNFDDMVRAGTWWQRKLTDEQVLAIRADPRTHKAIAVDFGVSSGLVGNIKRRHHWKNL